MNTKYPKGTLISIVALGGLVVIMLAITLKLQAFTPDRGRWILMGDKNP
jgi:hypothetical protein